MGKRAAPERMAAFFDARSDGYDAYMERAVAFFDRFYQVIANPIPETNEMLRILDIGCGTGLELDAFLSKAPNAVVTGVDVSQRMLQKLKAKYGDRVERLTLIQGSYLAIPLGESMYDYAVAVMTLHHLLPAPKVELYRRIRRALKQDGAYIEGDWVVSPEEERDYLREYEERLKTLKFSEEGTHHIDIPSSLETERQLLIEAGFAAVDVIWEADGNAVYVARG